MVSSGLDYRIATEKKIGETFFIYIFLRFFVASLRPFGVLDGVECEYGIEMLQQLMRRRVDYLVSTDFYGTSLFYSGLTLSSSSFSWNSMFSRNIITVCIVRLIVSWGSTRSCLFHRCSKPFKNLNEKL